MNIIIPMAGLGSRFPNSKIPKPLIDVNGKPMVQKAVESMGIKGNLIFIVRVEHNTEFHLDEKIKGLFPDSTIISVDHLTEGPACTAMLAKDVIEKDKPLIIANCDQIMHWDHETFNMVCSNYPNDGFVVTYFANTEKNSYAKLDNSGFVLEMKEKKVISNVSTNGIHFWKKGQFFIDSVYKMIEADDRAPNGEFYIAPSYNYLIKEGKKIGVYHIPNEQHWAVGTESDLEIYLRNNNE
jgi:dTDP-glucose pyrophosphorylase